MSRNLFVQTQDSELKTHSSDLKNREPLSAATILAGCRIRSEPFRMYLMAKPAATSTREGFHTLGSMSGF